MFTLDWIKCALRVKPAQNLRPCLVSCPAHSAEDAPRDFVSRRRGEWGEAVAADYLLKTKRWRLIGKRVRPCAADRRCEIDIIARTAEGGVVFVEVKAHRSRSQYASRLWRIDRRKKENLLRACSNWIMRKKWHGNFRFDVIEVYGTEESETPPEIDHIENVPLFPPKWRFW